MVKEVLKREVPERVQQAPEFNVFLRWCGQKKIKNRVQLKKVLREEIDEAQKKLKKRQKDMREGTNTRLTRQHAQKLKFLKTCRDRICRYL